MPRKDCEAVLEGNCPIPQQEEFGSGEPTLADIYRLCGERFDRQLKIMNSFFDRWDKKLDEISDETKKMDKKDNVYSNPSTRKSRVRSVSPPKKHYTPIKGLSLKMNSSENYNPSLGLRKLERYRNVLKEIRFSNVYILQCTTCWPH